MSSPAFQNLIYICKNSEHSLKTVGHKNFHVTAKVILKIRRAGLPIIRFITIHN